MTMHYCDKSFLRTRGITCLRMTVNRRVDMKPLIECAQFFLTQILYGWIFKFVISEDFLPLKAGYTDVYPPFYVQVTPTKSLPYIWFSPFSIPVMLIANHSKLKKKTLKNIIKDNKCWTFPKLHYKFWINLVCIFGNNKVLNIAKFSIPSTRWMPFIKGINC